MKKSIAKLVLSTLLVFSFIPNASAQGQAGISSMSFRQSLATIMFAGLGGAVLGLSTLSFYGQPQEHLGNIWMGLGIGVIGGSTYVAMQATSSARNNDRYSALIPGFDRLPEDKFHNAKLVAARFEF